ncbi:MAG: hypothetical protein B7Y74_07495 [Novosphingobium sp. 35-62-5]|nr:MAG: hypothetical protein B7Y74_07495 [Novosphingobium sp. 35-62-5]OZA66350.1 MAG: hypothetical protein B7X78_04670 [Sphingomonadales bacterium 39-62-4]
MTTKQALRLCGAPANSTTDISERPFFTVFRVHAYGVPRLIKKLTNKYILGVAIRWDNNKVAFFGFAKQRFQKAQTSFISLGYTLGALRFVTTLPTDDLPLPSVISDSLQNIIISPIYRVTG